MARAEAGNPTYVITQLIAGPSGGGIVPRLRGAAASGPCEIVVRLDSAQATADTLVAVREAGMALLRSGGRLVIVAGDPYVRRLLAMTALDRTFDVRRGDEARVQHARPALGGRVRGGAPPPDTLPSA